MCHYRTKTSTLHANHGSGLPATARCRHVEHEEGHRRCDAEAEQPKRIFQLDLHVDLMRRRFTAAYARERRVRNSLPFIRDESFTASALLKLHLGGFDQFDQAAVQISKANSPLMNLCIVLASQRVF